MSARASCAAAAVEDVDMRQSVAVLALLAAIPANCLAATPLAQLL
jgi:hypothetical protein